MTPAQANVLRPGHHVKFTYRDGRTIQGKVINFYPRIHIVWDDGWTGGYLPDDLAQVELTGDKSPYGEWCRDPYACANKGYCPRDPTCGD